MTIRDKIQLRPYSSDENYLDRALIRAGLIILAGYLVGTFIAWLIVR